MCLNCSPGGLLFCTLLFFFCQPELLFQYPTTNSAVHLPSLIVWLYTRLVLNLTTWRPMKRQATKKTKTNKKQEKGGRNSFLIIPLDVFHTRSRLRDPRCLTGRRWSHVTTVCRSCEGTMCRNLSCQNDRHISSCRHQNRELQVTKSGDMAAFFFFFLKKVAAAFSGRNFWEEKNLKELVGKFLSNSPCDDD